MDPVEISDNAQQFPLDAAFRLAVNQPLIKGGQGIQVFALKTHFDGFLPKDLIIGLLADRPTRPQAQLKTKTPRQGHEKAVKSADAHPMEILQ